MQPAAVAQQAYADGTRPAAAALGPPAPVGHGDMDQEHAECADALGALLQQPCRRTLMAAVAVLQLHFEHEERLMRASGFGGQVSGTDCTLGGGCLYRCALVQYAHGGAMIRWQGYVVGVSALGAGWEDQYQCCSGAHGTYNGPCSDGAVGPSSSYGGQVLFRSETGVWRWG
jgi:hypothetical protein